MDDFTFLNLILGPLGESFKIIKQRGKLYSEEDFVELTETQYALYTAKVVLIPGDSRPPIPVILGHPC